MGYALGHGWEARQQFQVFLLAPRKEPRTLTRPDAIPHHRSGRGSAFLQYKRYFPHSALLAATDTEHLA